MENKKIKILAIDDNFDNLLTLKALISESVPHAEVLTSQTGAEGIILAGKNDPDVILLDILMPGMDGFEVCRRLKADPELADIPVVFVTALNDDKHSRIKSLEVGGEAFLTKPVDESELFAQIHAMVKIKFANSIKRKENIELAALVDDRTRELERTNTATLNLLEDLKQEIDARKKTEEALRQSQEQLKIYAAHLENIREEERIILAREIHDELGQILVAIKIDLGLLGKKAEQYFQKDASGDFTMQFQRLAEVVNDTIKTTRRIMTDLRPEVIDFLGFVDAVKQYAVQFEERYEIKSFFINDIPSFELDAQRSVALFRIVQESMTNIAKHAHASEVLIQLGEGDNSIYLEISDNGVGFDVNTDRRSDSYGLIGMKERTFLLNGTFSLNSIPGKGTTVRVDVPLTS